MDTLLGIIFLLLALLNLVGAIWAARCSEQDHRIEAYVKGLRGLVEDE